MEGHERSRKVKEGHGWSFPITGLTFQGRKVTGGGVGWWPVGLYCQPQSHSFSFGLWILDLGLGFGTWIWDLDLGLDLGLTTINFQVNVNKDHNS